MTEELQNKINELGYNLVESGRGFVLEQVDEKGHKLKINYNKATKSFSKYVESSSSNKIYKTISLTESELISEIASTLTE